MSDLAERGESEVTEAVAKKNAKAEALKAIVAFAAEYGDDTIKELAKLFAKKSPHAPRAIKNGKLSYYGMLTALFPSVGASVDEYAVFQTFHVGRPEMRGYITDAIKRVKETERRLWIAFDADTGTYTLVGKGATAPDGWTGYTPAN